MPANPPNIGDWPTDDDIAVATELDEDREPAPARTPRPAFHLLTDDELEAEPAPEYLVDGLIVDASLVFIYGSPGSGKSFLAIDMSRAVAAGRPFLGRRTRQGNAVYIAAEGSKRGIAKRIRAWTAAKHDGESLSNFWVVAQPIPMIDAAAVAAFAAVVEKTAGKRVAMIVIDTLARSTAGAEENSSADMGRLVAACDYLRTRFGATIVVIHHSGKAESGMRGSSALHGAADTELLMRRDEKSGVITVSVAKQKDDAPAPPLRLVLEVLPDVGSCVLEHSDSAPPPEPDVLDRPRALACLTALRGLGASGSYADWQKASGLPGTSFNRMRGELIAKRLVEPLGDRYRVAREAESRL
jgi:hypothetical protein